MNPPAQVIQQAYEAVASSFHFAGEKVKCLRVIMAVVSLCHFCDHFSKCKSAADHMHHVKPATFPSPLLPAACSCLPRHTTQS